MIRFITNTQNALRRIERLKAAMDGGGARRVTETVAFWTFRELVLRTPKKWTGQVRRGWQITKAGIGWQVTNLNKVMLFLERGTRSHGPRTAKALFIPLTRKAAMGGQDLKFGRDYIFAKRVKGIAARHIVRDQRVRTNDKLFADMQAYVRMIALRE